MIRFALPVVQAFHFNNLRYHDSHLQSRGGAPTKKDAVPVTPGTGVLLAVSLAHRVRQQKDQKRPQAPGGACGPDIYGFVMSTERERTTPRQGAIAAGTAADGGDEVTNPIIHLVRLHPKTHDTVAHMLR
jgi:hypothetical protein